MLSHFALMMNPNLNEKELKECLEMSFESKHRQLDSIAEMEKQLRKQDEEADQAEAEWIKEVKEMNRQYPGLNMPVPFSRSSERRMESISLAHQMRMLVLLF